MISKSKSSPPSQTHTDTPPKLEWEAVDKCLCLWRRENLSFFASHSWLFGLRLRNNLFPACLFVALATGPVWDGPSLVENGTVKSRREWEQLWALQRPVPGKLWFTRQPEHHHKALLGYWVWGLAHSDSSIDTESVPTRWGVEMECSSCMGWTAVGEECLNPFLDSAGMQK